MNMNGTALKTIRFVPFRNKRCSGPFRFGEHMDILIHWLVPQLYEESANLISHRDGAPHFRYEVQR